MRKVPAILTDIDGVLLRGRTCIPRSDLGLKLLRKPLKELNSKLFKDVNQSLPLMAVTNGGGKLEIDRANELNKHLNLNNEHEKFGANSVVLNFSPLRPVLRDFKDKIILIAGIADIERIAEDCGMHKFVTITEYSALYPNLVPISLRKIEDRAPVLKRVKERMKIHDDKFFDEPFQVHAIFYLNDPVVWEESIQITMDFLTTEDGRIANKLPKEAPERHIPIYAVNNDFLYSDTFRLPRLAFGPFTESLKRVYQLIYNKPLHINYFGKPEKSTFAYAEKKLSELSDFKISNYYMVGDNPKSDIRGANAMNWVSILTRTGVFQQEENDDTDHATHVVADFYEAAELILKLEGIKD